MKTKKSFLIVTFLILFGMNNFSNAQCALDQNQPLWNGGTSERNLPGYFDWQSFTAGMSGGLCQVDVLFCNTTTLLVGTGTLNIYDGTGIAGTLLTSQAVNVNGSATAINIPFWQNFTINVPPNVVLGQIYTWQFIPTVGGGLTDPYLIQINIPDVYAGGVSYNFGTGGDITFRTNVDPTMSIKGIHNGNGFAVYPNPATDMITISANEGLENNSYSISDQLGRVVLTGEISSESQIINIADLAKGVYFLKIGEGNQAMIKVVKE